MKISGGVFGGRVLKTPKGEQTRPTTGLVRAAVFNVCQHSIAEARVLDLFAGSGAVGFEALSRGAVWVTFVEQHKQAAQCIRENMEMLEVQPQCQILSMPVKKALNELMSPYDLIYIDPPYDLAIQDVMHSLVEHQLVAPHAMVFLEQRYDPKAKEPQFSGLALVKSRRYGIAHLHQYSLT